MLIKKYLAHLFHLPSFLVLIRIHREGKASIFIPIPLWLFYATFEAWNDLIRFGGIFVSKSRWKIPGVGLPPHEFLSMLTSLFSELRRYGRWRFVEVNSGASQVYIDFI